MINLIKKWLISLGSPPLFFKWASKILPWFFPISILILLTGLIWGIGFAPTDYKQGDVYRVSGAFWGKPTWGTWWVWDARLTSTLILFFLYAGIISLYSSIDNKQKGDRAASLISVVGVIIIPIIKKSVDWWQTLHQPSTFTITSAPSMTSDMYLPLLICVIGFYCILFSILLNRLRAEILIRERNTSWVRQFLDNQIKE